MIKSEKAVLLFVADGATSKYEIAKTLKRSYSVVYYAIQKLLKLGFIEAVDSRSGEKNPKQEVRTYGLTLPGLMKALDQYNIWDDKERIDEFIHRWSYLHPFLGKWKYLNEKIPRNELIAVLSTLATSFDAEWRANLYRRKTSDDGRTLFSRRFLSLVLSAKPGMESSFAIDKWVDAIHGDKVLREFVVKQLKVDVDKERRELNYREKLLKQIQ